MPVMVLVLTRVCLSYVGVTKTKVFIVSVHFSNTLFSTFQIASRCLSTVHNTLVELSLLGATAVEGAAACWAQLACAETLRACERLAANNNALDMCTATQAPLLHNAKDKVRILLLLSNNLSYCAVEGVAACWAQLTCAETLRACERLAANNNASSAAA